jgi:hypothetical protein
MRHFGYEGLSRAPPGLGAGPCPHTQAVIVEAILSLATPERPAEVILSAPTAREWTLVARRIAQTPRRDDNDDDDARGDEERARWTVLGGLCVGALAYLRRAS